MCRQGNYVGMTQRSKCFIDAIYSAGTISEQTVFCCGMGAKGRGQLEKMLLSEALHLFLGDGSLSCKRDQNTQHKLKPGAIASLENKLKTKLDRMKLDQENCINSDDDSANYLFNGVVHIYNRINQATNQDVSTMLVLKDYLIMLGTSSMRSWNMNLLRTMSQI